MPGQLEKVKIYAYGDNAYSDYKDKFYEFKINPEKMTLSRSILYNEDDRSTGAERSPKQYQGHGTDTMSFDIVIDGTGVASEVLDVDDELKTLQEVLYEYKDDTHKPYHLLIAWGKDNKFLCQLKSINIEYSLFKPSGETLRAKVSLQFEDNTNPETVQNISQPASPDLTHMKLVSQGDNLLQMCHDMYGDKKYYIAVARINGLTNFRELKTGSYILLPPMQKRKSRN